MGTRNRRRSVRHRNGAVLTLRQGAGGLPVARLHQSLARAGHRPAPAEVEATRFGPSTAMAVRAFQEACGLRVTGIADPDTFAKLDEEG